MGGYEALLEEQRGVADCPHEWLHLHDGCPHIDCFGGGYMDSFSTRRCARCSRVETCGRKGDYACWADLEPHYDKEWNEWDDPRAAVFVENHDGCCCGSKGHFPAEWLTEAEGRRRYEASRKRKERQSRRRSTTPTPKRAAMPGAAAQPTPPKQNRHPERVLQQEVQRLATEGGWRWHHCAHASGCEGGRGWPDLILLRGSELLAVELKSDKGTVAVVQTRWLFAWREAGAECHVWQPSDLPAIKKRLIGKAC